MILDLAELTEEQYCRETLVQQAVLLGTADDRELRMCARGSPVCRADMREMAARELARRAMLAENDA